MESEGLKRAPHRRVVLVGVAAQIVSVLCCELEDRPSDTVSAYRSHAVNDVVVGIRTPGAIDLGIGFVGPWSEGEYGKWPLVVGHDVGKPMLDVRSNDVHAGIPVGPLCGVPVRLHESSGMLIRAINELEVVRGSDLNLRLPIIRELAPYRVPCLSPTVDSLVLVGSDQANVFQCVCTVQDLSIKCGEA